MTKQRKLEHLGEALKWLEKAIPLLAEEGSKDEPFLFEGSSEERLKEAGRCLYNAIRRVSAVVEELVKDQPTGWSGDYK